MQDPLIGDDAARLQGFAGRASGHPGGNSAADAPGVRPRRLRVAENARDRALEAARAQQERFANRLHNVSAAARRSASQMEGEQAWIASAVHALADEVDGLASRLRGGDLNELVTNIRHMAARQPGLFVGASLAAGFAAARLAKLAAADASRGGGRMATEVGHG